ncbi:uncharacterized protein RJT20DRAFT_55042 [Scheffersomyces xylosifermentans]|uniref:uncharacterized protein n=1 Tax=Scheffersomyces xylosifermentans TaxID=1304137 RepID=UPI00315D5A75
MTMIGKAVHIGVDLVLVSAFLAGVKRNTGLTVDLDQIENESVRYYSGKYLGVGEKVFDFSSAYFSSSDYFTRK